MCRPNRSETGQSGRSPHDPIELVSSLSCIVECHGAAPMDPEKVDPSNSQRYAVGHSRWWGVVATRTIVKQTTSVIAPPPKESATRRRPCEAPSQPIRNTQRRREGSWSRRCRSRSRQSSPAKQWARTAREGISRTATCDPRGTSSKRQPHATTWPLVAHARPADVHVRSHKCMCYQRARRLVNRETVIVGSNRAYCSCGPW